MKKLKTLSIASNNAALLIKSVFLQMLILSVAVGICMIFVPPVIDYVKEFVSELEIKEFVNNFFEDIASDEVSSEVLATKIADKIVQIINYFKSVPNMLNKVELSYLLVLLLMCVYRMFIAVPDIAVAYTLNEFMSTNARRPYIWYLVKKFGKSIKFALLQLCIAFPLDLVIGLASISLYLVLLAVFNCVSPIPAVVIGLILYTFRHTMLAYWLPSIVVGDMTVVKALSNNFATLSTRFWSVFFRTLIVFALMVIITFVVNKYMLSWASALLTAIINLVFFYFVKCINIVEYYEAKELPYFATKISIYGVDKKSKTA